MSDDFLLPPPSSLIAYSETKPLLYDQYDRPLRRQIGFAMQTTSTLPQVKTGGKTIGGKKPSKGGKRGC